MAVFWQRHNQKQLSEYIASLEDRVDDLTSKLASLTIELNAANEEASHLRTHAKSPREFEEMQRILDAKLEESQARQAAIVEKYAALLSAAQTETQRLMRENETLCTRLALSDSRVSDLEASIQSIRASRDRAYEHTLGQTIASIQPPDRGERTNSTVYQKPEMIRKEKILKAYKIGLSLGSFVFDVSIKQPQPTTYDESALFEDIVEEVLAQKRVVGPAKIHIGLRPDDTQRILPKTAGESLGDRKLAATPTLANTERGALPEIRTNNHSDKTFARNEIIDAPVTPDTGDAIMNVSPLSSGNTGASPGARIEESHAASTHADAGNALPKAGKTIPEMKINTNIKLVDLFGKKRR